MSNSVLFTPLGRIIDEKNVISDEITYANNSEERKHCKPRIFDSIGKHLNLEAEDKDIKYIAVCIPCYDEDLVDLLKTIISVMENFEFMNKKVVINFLFIATVNPIII